MLECSAIGYSMYIPTFRRNSLPPSLGSESEAKPDPYNIYNFPYSSDFSALKLEKAGSSRTLASTYPTTQCQIPEGHALNFSAVQNLKSNIKIVDASMLCCIYSGRKYIKIRNFYKYSERISYFLFKCYKMYVT